MMNISKKNILKYAEKYDKQYKGSYGEEVEKEMKALLKNKDI